MIMNARRPTHPLAWFDGWQPPHYGWRYKFCAVLNVLAAFVDRRTQQRYNAINTNGNGSTDVCKSVGG